MSVSMERNHGEYYLQRPTSTTLSRIIQLLRLDYGVFLERRPKSVPYSRLYLGSRGQGHPETLTSPNKGRFSGSTPEKKPFGFSLYQYKPITRIFV
jgi:hypothetical protein